MKYLVLYFASAVLATSPGGAFALKSKSKSGKNGKNGKNGKKGKSEGTPGNPFPNDFVYVGHVLQTSNFADYAGTPRVGIYLPVKLEAARAEGWSKNDNKNNYDHPDHPMISASYGKCGKYNKILTGLSVIGPKSPLYKNGYADIAKSPIDGYDAAKLGMLTVSYCDNDSTPSEFGVKVEQIKRKYPLTLSAAEEYGYKEGGCSGSMGGTHYWNGNLKTPQDWADNDLPAAAIYDKGKSELATIRFVFGDFMSAFGAKYPLSDPSVEFAKSITPNYGVGFDNAGIGVLDTTACSFGSCGQTDCLENIATISSYDAGATSMHVMFYDPSNVEQWAKCQKDLPETCQDEGDNAYLSCPCEGIGTCCGEDGDELGVFPGFYFPPAP